MIMRSFRHHGIRKCAITAALMLAALTVGSMPAFAQWGAPTASPYGLSADSGYPANSGYRSGYYDYAPGAVVAAPTPSSVGTYYDVAPYYYRVPDSSSSYQFGWHDPAGCGPGAPVC